MKKNHKKEKIFLFRFNTPCGLNCLPSLCYRIGSNFGQILHIWIGINFGHGTLNFVRLGIRFWLKLRTRDKTLVRGLKFWTEAQTSDRGSNFGCSNFGYSNFGYMLKLWNYAQTLDICLNFGNMLKLWIYAQTLEICSNFGYMLKLWIYAQTLEML